MKRGRAVLTEGTARAKAWRGEIMPDVVGMGGCSGTAESLVYGETMRSGECAGAGVRLVPDQDEP